MPNLRIHRPGPLTTVQDRGRFGLQALGIPTAGAADGFGYRLGNRLLGNCETAAALEYWILGPEIEAVDAPVRVALVAGGGTLTRAADGSRWTMPAWRTVTLMPGDRIALGPTVGGAVGYACVSGGVDVPVVMGSRSTYVRAKLGGFEGRPLKTGDVVAVGVAADPADGNRALVEAPVDGEGPFRVILGPQDDYFAAEAVDRFFSQPFAISPQSDRMGKRLTGAPLAFAGGKTADIASDAMVAGAIQVPGSGEPIVMLADRATVGGYAKIGAVIGADLPRFARLKPGAEVRFAHVSVGEAEAAARAFETLLSDVAAAAVAVE